MDDLYFQFEDLFIQIAIIIDKKVPLSLMAEMEFFIVDPYMSPICRTNSTLAHKIGQHIATSSGSTIIAIKALYILFLARDSMIKGCPTSTVKELLDNCGEFLRIYDLCSKLELNYG
jgi:hypothetical protein